MTYGLRNMMGMRIDLDLILIQLDELSKDFVNDYLLVPWYVPFPNIKKKKALYGKFHYKYGLLFHPLKDPLSSSWSEESLSLISKDIMEESGLS